MQDNTAPGQQQKDQRGFTMGVPNELTWEKFRERLIDYQGGEFAAYSPIHDKCYRASVKLITVIGSGEALVFKLHCEWKASSRDGKVWEIENDDDTIECELERAENLREDSNSNRIFFDYHFYARSQRTALRVTLHPRWGHKLKTSNIRGHPDYWMDADE